MSCKFYNTYQLMYYKLYTVLYTLMITIVVEIIIILWDICILINIYSIYDTVCIMCFPRIVTLAVVYD